MSFDAVVLAGGSARRLGRDKPEEPVGGRRLLDRVLAAVAGAQRVVVVGPPRRVPPGVLLVQERPAGGGPLAGVAAALPMASSPWTVLLAADLPFLTAEDVAELLAAAADRDGAAVLSDGSGRPQWFAGAYPTGSLRLALASVDPAGLPAGRVLAPLVSAILAPPADRERPPRWLDCDTPEDLECARRLA